MPHSLLFAYHAGTSNGLSSKMLRIRERREKIKKALIYLTSSTAASSGMRRRSLEANNLKLLQRNIMPTIEQE